MSWGVSLYWQLHEAQRAFVDAFMAWAYPPPSYRNGGFLCDLVGAWDHERKCVKTP